MENDLVSIIVPVYNVEEFVNRCMNSLIDQTYKNLQIIVVNDGSKDNSLEKVIVYQKIDPRVEIYTKQNGGLSSARNYGMQFVRGNYVCFVDSDDWVALDYIEILYGTLIHSNADISCAGFAFAYDSRKEKYQYDMKTIVLNAKDAMLCLCEGKWLTNHVWNKFYKAELFNGVRFEEGRCFEDIYIMHQLFDRAGSVACNAKIIYYYYMRDNSIVHEVTPQKEADIFIGYYKRYMFLKSEKTKNYSLKYCAWSCYRLLYLLDSNKVKKDDIKIAKIFWQDHEDIASLGLKYFIMYRFPKIYRYILRN